MAKNNKNKNKNKNKKCKKYEYEAKTGITTGKHCEGNMIQPCKVVHWDDVSVRT